jgi:hypothetical protein
VVLIGGPGTGKTHLATAIGIEAIQRIWARALLLDGGAGQCAGAGEGQRPAGPDGLRLMYVDLVILDELGYLPFSQAGGALLFHLLSKLYEHTSVIDHDQSVLHRVGQRVQRCQDDHGAARPPDASLPHRRDRQRVLALQNEFGQAAAWPNSFPKPQGDKPPETEDLPQNRVAILCA